MKDLPTLMMESFVVVVNQHRKAQGLSHKAFAENCWPASSPKAASMRWQAMRSIVPGTGKPQGVLIYDAQCMASVLNIDLAYLMMESMHMSRNEMDKKQ